ncbi:hypothetical protein RND81_14G089300 [Saponaria officinalis]|uniref:Desiccation-related protein PCC13-62 n=1 Tax=Saponaria officinalis TaxID=3572 RepID=A0AAW1GJY0_SAPOF
MAFPTKSKLNTTLYLLISVLCLLFNLSNCTHMADSLVINVSQNQTNQTIPKGDIDLIEFALNVEYLEAEFFLHGALGHGLDKVAPHLAAGGPPPVGPRKARLDPLVNSIVYQFGLQEVGNIRAMKKVVKGFPRPRMNLSTIFAEAMDKAFGRPLMPPFEPYATTLHYLIGCYMIPLVGLTSYVDINSKLHSPHAQKLIGSLLAVESGQDAVIRTLMYERRLQRVYPYGIPLQDFTIKISNIRNKLAKAGIRDEGLVVEPSLGAEGKSALNILSCDKDSMPYSRTPAEVLRIFYSSGDEHHKGGFFPDGAGGNIAKSFLVKRA